MASTATVIILTAGTLTFGTEWYETHKLDWKVPVATLLLAPAFDVFSKIDTRGANILSFMILLGAATTEFNGKSFVNILEGLGPSSPKTTGSSKMK